jgi:glyoxylase-like metal-dependent hydrolase (beta-lactamase superfamily II)/predicted  nucleic acid-binding Zn-ribbon protein
VDQLRAQAAAKSMESDTLQATYEQLENSIAQKQSLLDRLEDRYASLTNGAQDMQDTQEGTERQIGELQNQIWIRKTHLKDIERETETQTARRDALLEEVESLTQQFEDFGLDIEIARYKDLLSKIDQLESQVGETRASSKVLSSTHEQLEVLVAQRQEQIADLEERHESWSRQVEELQQTVADLERRNRNLRAKLLRRETKAEQLDAKIKQARQTTGDLEARSAELVSQIDQKRQQLESLRSERAQAETRTTQARSKLCSLEEAREALTAMVHGLQDNQADARYELSELQKSIQESETTLVQIHQSLEEKTAQRSQMSKDTGELTQRLHDLRQSVEEWQAKKDQLEEVLPDLEEKTRRATNELLVLQAQKRMPLWQAILRSDLNVGEITPHVDLVLDRLGKGDPASADALRLEIAARTGMSQLTIPDVECADRTSRLFADVIQARGAYQESQLVDAVQMLCDGWEAVLSETPPKARVSSAHPSSAVAPSDKARSLDQPFPGEPAQGATQPSRVDAGNDHQHPVSTQLEAAPLYVTAQRTTLTLETKDIRVLVDPGPDPMVTNASPDLVLVTHAHDDHVHQLVPLCEQFPDVPVVMTPQTNDLLGLSKNDWAKISERQVHCVEMRDAFAIQGIEISFLPAGHILGAAMADLRLKDRRILITGDFCLRSVGGLDSPAIPTQPYDLVLMEAVHASDTGYPSSDPRENRRESLMTRVLEAVAGGYTRILIPASAIGNAQEVYDALWEVCMAGDASPLSGYQLCLDGLAYHVAQLYAETGTWNETPQKKGTEFPSQTIVIASIGAAEQIRGQLGPAQRACVLEPKDARTLGPSGGPLRAYQVDLHASLDELARFGQQVHCGLIGLYHSDRTKGSPLEHQLLSVGKRVIQVTHRDRLRID